MRVDPTCALCSAAGLVFVPVSCSVAQPHRASFPLSRPSSVPRCHGQAVTGNFSFGLVHCPIPQNNFCPATVKAATVMSRHCTTWVTVCHDQTSSRRSITGVDVESIIRPHRDTSRGITRQRRFRIPSFFGAHARTERVLSPRHSQRREKHSSASYDVV